MNLDSYTEHMPPLVPSGDAQEVSRHFLEKCPVAHSDQDGGFWIVNRDEDFVRVMQDWRTFESGSRGVYVPNLKVERPPMAPMEYNPPIQRKIKEILSPFFSPKVLAQHEERFREIIGGIIDKFASTGQCDIAQQLAKQYPGQIVCEALLGVTDPDQLDQLSRWIRIMTYDFMRLEPAILVAAQSEFRSWCADLVENRRSNPQDDVVSALLSTPVHEDGRCLEVSEIVGTIQLMLLAGFGTTADATSSIVIRLIEEPGLEKFLRENPERIPAAIEEVLRLDPPVTTRPRRATEDVEIGGRVIKKGERILCNFLAANIDPEARDDPEEFRIDRTRNRAVTFGIGPHRCSGSTMARIELRIMVEELLKRVTDIAWDGNRREERVSFLATVWRGIDSLPVIFTPVSDSRPHPASDVARP